MALSDRVTTRYSHARLVELTNPGKSAGTTTVDTDRLAAACEDAEAEFEAVCGVAYDDTDTKHRPVAVLAAEWKLLTYGAAQDAATERVEKAFLAAAERLALTSGGRARILPQTSSQLTPSQEVPDGVEVRPDFDRRNLSGITLRSPRAPARRGSSFREEDD